MKNFQLDPKTTNHPNRVRNKPTNCPELYLRSETATQQSPRVETSVPTWNQVARQAVPQSQTQRRQRTPHNPYTEGADEISDPHLAKAGSDPFLPWVPEQGARTGLTSTVQIARSPL